jgi:hypothetical protein
MDFANRKKVIAVNAILIAGSSAGATIQGSYLARGDSDNRYT